MRMIECQQCGKTMEADGKKSFCPECRAERKRQKDNEYHARKRAETRLIKCQKCGKPMETDGEKCFCPECRREIKVESIIRERECRTCGKLFLGGPRAWYCPECRAERKRQREKEYYARKQAGTVRHIGSTDICVICGGKYIVDGGIQKYCPDCAEAAVRAICKEKATEWNAQNKTRIKKRKQEHQERLGKTRPDRTCKVCGAQFRPHKSDVTCSPSCARLWLSYKQSMANFRRGHRETAPDMDEIRERLSRQSGVKGVSRSTNGTRWKARWSGKYIGTYDTVEEAAEAIERYKNATHNS